MPTTADMCDTSVINTHIIIFYLLKLNFELNNAAGEQRSSKLFKFQMFMS